MNTRIIRYECPDMIESLENSIKRYMDWNQSSGDYVLNEPIFRANKELAEFYDYFLEQCVLDDIEDLKKSILEEK